MDELAVDGRAFPVEVVETLVRSYLVRAPEADGLAPGRRVELVIAGQPPVPCTVERVEAAGVRLLRGWGAP